MPDSPHGRCRPAQPPGKYAVGNGARLVHECRLPATAAVDEAFNTFVLPTMFARVARDEATPEDTDSAPGQIARIFERRDRG